MSLTAIILAGGKGSRLAPWPAPKCLLPINGVPILRRILEHIEPHIDEAVICTGYRSDDVVRAVESWGVTNLVSFSDAGENATMMSRIRLAAGPHFHTRRILVLYGDELADVDIPSLVQVHNGMSKARKLLMTLTLFPTELPFGVAQNGYIVEGMKASINIGYAIIESSALDYAGYAQGLSDFFNALARLNDPPAQTQFYYHSGKRATINSLSDLEHAEELWK